MNILLLNGSPKGENSNTFKLAATFVEGLNADAKNFVQVVEIAKARIEPCRGCYACWTKTPGKCALGDDMAGLLLQYIEADLVIWSFPLYYFSMPSQIKGFMDRLLPLNLPQITAGAAGQGHHPPRYDLSGQRHVLISTCGFYSTQGNYDALLRQFEILFNERLTKIFCPQGELFRVPYLAARTDEYLSYVKKAGQEYAAQGVFSPATQDKLNELLYKPEVFMEMANADWDTAETEQATEQPGGESYRYMRQMAALYNPRAYTKDIVLEMAFTDLDTTYQLLLGREKCQLTTSGFIPYTTRIETPFATWLRISAGEISGAEAMMKHLYRVTGDFDTMLHMDDFFSSGTLEKPSALAPAPQSTGRPKAPNMLLLLLPYIALWVLLPLDSRAGAMAGVVTAALLPLLHLWWKPVIYERLGAFAVTLISLYILVSGGQGQIITLSFFTFGALWLGSCFTKIPLTSYYSCKGYGGEAAFANPLFIRTNLILTAIWGLAYLLLGLAALFIAQTALAPLWVIISNVPTALLGAFTLWFSRWYPAHVARG